MKQVCNTRPTPTKQCWLVIMKFFIFKKLTNLSLTKNSKTFPATVRFYKDRIFGDRVNVRGTKVLGHLLLWLQICWTNDRGQNHAFRYSFEDFLVGSRWSQLPCQVSAPSASTWPRVHYSRCLLAFFIIYSKNITRVDIELSGHFLIIHRSPSVHHTRKQDLKGHLGCVCYHIQRII